MARSPARRCLSAPHQLTDGLSDREKGGGTLSGTGQDYPLRGHPPRHRAASGPPPPPESVAADTATVRGLSNYMRAMLKEGWHTFLLYNHQHPQPSAHARLRHVWASWTMSSSRCPCLATRFGWNVPTPGCRWAMCMRTLPGTTPWRLARRAAGQMRLPALCRHSQRDATQWRARVEADGSGQPR